MYSRWMVAEKVGGGMEEGVWEEPMEEAGTLEGRGVLL